jgi:WD40 repeat protein
MVRRTVLLGAAAALMLAAAACNYTTNSNGKGVNAGTEKGESADPVKIGAALYTVVALQPAPPVPGAAGGEPILFQSYLTILDKQDVPSQRDGKIVFIGTEVKPTDPPQEGRKYHTHRGQRYRALEAGERVEAHQVIALLDDGEAYAELEAKRVGAESGKKIYEKSVEVRKSAEEIYRLKLDLQKKSNLSALEFIQAIIELNRAIATETQSEADWKKAEADHDKAKIYFEYFTIRTDKAGTIQPFTRKAGESIKASETLLQIQATDVLRAEGSVAVGYIGRLKRFMPVLVEPLVEEAPRSRRRFHTQAINGVAVAGNLPNPYIVSVSDDKTARVWDGRSDYETAIFTHQHAVRSVACSPPGAAHQYCLTGAEDGKGRLWDLNNPKSSSTPARELDNNPPAHKGAISAVAFSPNGKLCATADSRDIALWDVDSGKLKYMFPQHHLGEITTLTFTPQAKLVSASRDLTVRVWSLGQDGARLDYTQEGRSGDVGRPGVSPDGRYFLLDISQSLRLMSIPERRTEGVVESAGETAKLSSFAIFSNDSRFVITGNQGEGNVSVWRTPTPGNRAVELRHFVPRERMVQFSCAAVAPMDREPFAVTGTRTGEVHLWPMPAEAETTRLPGMLMYIDQTANSATHQIRVYADFDNSKAQLPVGTSATVVAEPVTK